MKYWDEMLSKYGFSDGEAVPSGVERYREVYIAAINLLAAAYGSCCRVAPYDRPWMHNWCLVVFVKPDCIPATPDSCPETEETPDEAMDRALLAAGDLDLDSYVMVRAVVDVKGLQKYLRAAVPA